MVPQFYPRCRLHTYVNTRMELLGIAKNRGSCEIVDRVNTRIVLSRVASTTVDRVKSWIETSWIAWNRGSRHRGSRQYANRVIARCVDYRGSREIVDRDIVDRAREIVDRDIVDRENTRIYKIDFCPQRRSIFLWYHCPRLWYVRGLVADSNPSVLW